MTQPAVSLAIKELEQYYGVRLFDRIGRRLQITDAGKQFLQYAIHITDLFEDMETMLRDWGTKGILRVGASITIGSQFSLKRGLIVTVEVEGLVFPRNFYIVYHKDKFLTDAARAFIELCRNYEPPVS